MKKIFGLIFTLCFLFSADAFAKADIRFEQGALLVKEATYAELEELFEKYDYVDFGKTNLQVPRIYVKTLPTDWEKIEKSDEKNKVFIRILIPLIMKINEEIAIERNAISSLYKSVQENKSLSKKEKDFIEEKAEKYDIFSKNKSQTRYKLLLEELMQKVDEIPAGLLIAMSGIYSDWGNSRLAVSANSLYREEIWYSDEGLAPEDVPNAEFKYRIFSSLEECLRSFMHKLNSNITYRYIWATREQSREIGRKVLGEQIIAAMSYEGKFNNVAGMLDFNLSYYKLNKTDILPVLVDVKP